MLIKSTALKASLSRLDKIANRGKKYSDELTDHKLKPKSKKRTPSEIGHTRDFHRFQVSEILIN